MLRGLLSVWKKFVRENVRVMDNVIVTLEDIHTGNKRIVTSHNASLNYSHSALAQWVGGINNTGYQAVVPPSQIELGSGSGTPSAGDVGLFSPYSATLTPLSYVTVNSPSQGTTTFVFQIPAGKVTTQVTEALMRDVNGNNWFHTMFGTAFTPTASENLTIQWQVTFS